MKRKRNLRIGDGWSAWAVRECWTRRAACLAGLAAMLFTSRVERLDGRLRKTGFPDADVGTTTPSAQQFQPNARVTRIPAGCGARRSNQRDGVYSQVAR